LGDEGIDDDNGLFDNSGTNFTAYSETFLDKTAGNMSYERSKKNEIFEHFSKDY